MITYVVIIASVMLFGGMAQARTRTIEASGKVTYSKTGPIFVWLCAAILIFVAGFRYRMGTDYGNYVNAYENYRDDWLTYVQEFNEPGIAILIKIASLVYNDPVSMFVICSIVTIALYINTLKKYSAYFLYSILLYIFIGSWHGSFNAMRQYLAAAVLFAGHRYLYDRKLIKYALVVLLAMAFHRTALIMLPIYFIVGRELNLKNIALSVVMILAIRYGYDFLFSTMNFLKGSDQTQFSYMKQEVNVLRIAVSFAPVFLILVIRKTAAFRKRDTQFYCMMLIVNGCLMLATESSAYLARAAIYAEVYLALGLPRIMEAFENKTAKFLPFLIISLYGLYWAYELSARDLVPFLWVFGR